MEFGCVTWDSPQRWREGGFDESTLCVVTVPDESNGRTRKDGMAGFLHKIR